MKKIALDMLRYLIVMLVTSSMFYQCYDSPESNAKPKTIEFIGNDLHDELQVMEIDSCEYLVGWWGNATVMTHKGNCKYCLKRYLN